MVLRREVAQGQVQLRCQDENGQRGLEPDAAVGEAHADGDGDERDPERRGQLEHGPREERHAQGPHRRAAVLLARLRDRRNLSVPAIERPQRREASHDVEEVRREEGEGTPARVCLTLGVPADEDHEDEDERQGQQHERCRGEVDGDDPGDHG